ncbi:MAG: hypothetical protein CO135_04035 [Candidatus Levybacteria bacterium CG_4_9_14_3_um_filter_35_16]|nr:MAG: hypothetical protein CO135_04035 [Candidatus Levybacteria bacterium CG_4_9_14_3_um_filter_35_16]
MRREYIFAILISFAVLLFSNLPIIHFNLFPNDNLVFLNRRLTNSQDVYTYVSFIEQAKQGKILFENLFSSEPQTSSILRPSYLLIGNFAKIFNVSSIFTYNLFRILFSLTFCFILYKFLSRFFETEKKRLFAFSLILTSAGLGWLSFFFPLNSTDLWVPESITFMSFSEAPHFMLSQTLMLLGFYYFLEFTAKKKLLKLIYSFIFITFLTLEHPFNVIVIISSVVVYLLWTGYPRIKTLLIGALFSLGLIFQFFFAYLNPTLKNWKEASLASPSPEQYLMGFGLLLIFTIFGIEQAFRNKDNELKILLTWIFFTAILIYAPLNPQRRFLEGVHIPISLVAVFGIITIFSYLRKTLKENAGFILPKIAGFLIIILSLSSFFSIFRDFQTIAKDNPKDYYYYLNPSEPEAMDLIKKRTNSNDVILSNWFYGNLIPGLTGRKVYVGHKYQTFEFDNKVNKINSFLLEKNDKTALSFLQSNKISYIFLGVNDSMLKYGFKPDKKPYLQKVYAKNGVFVYKVKSILN